MEEKYLKTESFPDSIIVESSSRCNLKCIHCGHGHGKLTRDNGRMDMKLYRKIADEIAVEAPSTNFWLCFYGEPLLLGYRLFNMINYAKKIGLQNVNINTNGTLLDDENATGLIEAGLDKIVIGVDAITKETYSKIRINGDFERTKENITSLLERKRNGEFSKPRIFLQFIVMEENEAELEEFKDYWSGLEAELLIRPKLTWSGAVKADNLLGGDRYPCYWLMNVMPVTWDGDVPYCGCDFNKAHPYGSVVQKSLKSMWQEIRKPYRDAQLYNDYSKLPKFCQDCKDWSAMEPLDYHKYMVDDFKTTLTESNK